MANRRTLIKQAFAASILSTEFNWMSDAQSDGQNSAKKGGSSASRQAAGRLPRLRHTVSSNFESFVHVHGGAGATRSSVLIASDAYPAIRAMRESPPSSGMPFAFQTPFMLLSASTIPPGAGIGHHFHHMSEEVYIILDGNAEFTVNGRTSLLNGLAGAPCRLRDSHAIYNSGKVPATLLVFAVSKEMGSYEAFDLADDRVGAPLDPRPVFLNFTVDRPPPTLVGDVTSRRIFPSSVFSTSWAYLDHVIVRGVMPAHVHHDLEEVYYVVTGAGVVEIDAETFEVHGGDAFPVFFGERRAISTSDPTGLELLVAGIGREKGKG